MVETVDSRPATKELLEKSVNTIRFLAIDALKSVNLPVLELQFGCAPVAHILFDEVLRYNPKNPYWFNRDRFMLHLPHDGCRRIYIAVVDIADYIGIQEEGMGAFRLWENETPDYPEFFPSFGDEVLFGPLDQGIANSVRLAMIEKYLAARFNKPDMEIIDYYTYVVFGDGCQIDEVSNEACSFAGCWGLGKLIAFYDDIHVSIDGNTEIAFIEDVNARFEALGWHTIWVKNGDTGYDDIRAAIKEAKSVKNKPTLIKVTTTTGYGLPNKANIFSAHGSELGGKEIEAIKQNLGWPNEPFHVPEEVQNHWIQHLSIGSALEAEWKVKFAEYEKKYKEDADMLKQLILRNSHWEENFPNFFERTMNHEMATLGFPPPQEVEFLFFPANRQVSLLQSVESTNERSIYIVLMGLNLHDDDPDIVTASHLRLLSSVFSSKEEALDSIVYSYKYGFSGFAARLRDAQADKLKESPEVTSVRRDSFVELATPQRFSGANSK